MQIKTVLLDLDGTLTDSGPGIMNSVMYAAQKLCIKVMDPSSLRCFIGPPLKEQFAEFFSLSEEESVQALAYYREYYRQKGIFENSVYKGIPALLEGIKKAGLYTAVATSKPEEFAKTIIEHFGLSSQFDFVGGSLMDGGRTNKAEVIEYVLKICHIKERDQVLMIGDREHDIIGAKAAGVHSMGVLYGYGTREELVRAGAQYLADTPQEALDIILHAQ